MYLKRMYSVVIHREGFLPDFCVATDQEALWRTLICAYRPFLTSSPRAAAVLQLDFVEKNSILVYGRPGEKRREKRVEAGQALQEIENIIYEASYLEDAYFALHCGVVEKNGKAYLLAGKTGAGKSTLTAYLCHSGFRYLSDDVALFSLLDSSLIPFPRPLQLRQGGADILRARLPFLHSTEIIDSGDFYREVMLFPSPAKHCYPLGGVYFLRRLTDFRGEPERLCPLAKPEAFLRLLKSQFFYREPSREHYGFLLTILQPGAYELAYRDMEYARMQIGKDG